MDETTTGRTIDLPASHAFVVQLAASVGADTPFRGRIEHLASGSVTHFESLTQLGAFVLGVLAAASAPPAAPDWAGQEAPRSRADWRSATGLTESAPRRTATKGRADEMKQEHEHGASRKRRGANRGRAVVIAAALLA